MSSSDNNQNNYDANNNSFNTILEQYNKIFKEIAMKQTLTENLIKLSYLEIIDEESYKYSIYTYIENFSIVCDLYKNNKTFQINLNNYLNNDIFSDNYENLFIKSLLEIPQSANLSKNTNTQENNSKDSQKNIISSNILGKEILHESNPNLEKHNHIKEVSNYVEYSYTDKGESIDNFSSITDKNILSTIKSNQVNKYEDSVSYNSYLNNNHEINETKEKNLENNNNQQVEKNPIINEGRKEDKFYTTNFHIENNNINNNLNNREIITKNNILNYQKNSNPYYNRNFDVQKSQNKKNYYHSNFDSQSKSRLAFYSIFENLSKDKSNKNNFIYTNKKNFFEEITKKKKILSSQSKINTIFQIISNKDNFNYLDEELRLIYLNFLALTYIFFSNSQKEQIETEILEQYLLNNINLGNISKKSQIIYKEIFFFNKNSKNSSSNLKSDTIINDYLNKRDEFNDEDLFKLVNNIQKKHSLKSLYRILIYDELLNYLEDNIKIKMKFFFYILMENSEKISHDQELLKTFYVFKYFFYEKNNSVITNEIEESNINNNFFQNQNFSDFTSTGIETVDLSLKNLFIAKFHKNKDSLMLDNINFDDIYVYSEIKDIFKEHEIILFESVIEKIGFFYKKKLTKNKKNNRLSLISTEKIKFVFNIIDLFHFKTIFKIDYKNSFVNLEKKIIHEYEKINPDFLNNNETFLNPSLLYPKQYSAFLKLQKNVKSVCDNVNSKFKSLIKADLIPFGSVTQFLGSKDADLDLYLNIYSNNSSRENEDKSIFIENLYSYLKKTNNNKKIDFVMTKRLFTISFELDTEYSSVKIDINFTSCLGILNSSLLRTYSLIDQRFLILSIFIKFIVSKMEIKNDERVKDKINNYSWTFILLTFLQDVIQPPILPKLLSIHNKNGSTFQITEKLNTDRDNSKKKDFRKFFQYEDIKNYFDKRRTENFHNIPNFSESQKIIEEFKLNNDNQMSLSEILVSFLEYIIYYYKFDTNFLYTAGNDLDEGFYSRSILKQDFKDIEDRFRNDNVIIRDPFDKNYNPTKNVDVKMVQTIKYAFKKYYNDIFVIKEKNL